MDLIDTWQRVYAPYVRARFGEQAGAGLVEYALLTALIAMVCVGAVSVIGGAVSDSYENVGTGFTPAP